MAGVEDSGQPNAFIERLIEDAGHLPVANIFRAQIGIGGHNRVIQRSRLSPKIKGLFIRFCIDSQRTVPSDIENDDISLLWLLHQVLIHRRQDAGSRGRAIFEQMDMLVVIRKPKLTAGEQVAHGSNVIRGTSKIGK